MFLGPDGAGKTTAATLPPAGPILSDDQVVLRLEHDQFTAHGTPWGRWVCPGLSAPVGALFFLEQAERFELVPLAPGGTLSALWGRHPS